MQDTNTQNVGLDDGGFLDGMMDLSFTRFITLGVIKVLYVLGLVLIALGWLGMLISSLFTSVGAFFGVLIVGPIAVILYAIALRVWLELVVVMFRIGENTRKLVELQSPPAPPAAPAEPTNPPAT
jgi:uncharacterized membrane protein